MSNLEITVQDSIKLPVKNPVYETVQITNVFGTEAVVFEGTVLSFDATTEKYNVTHTDFPALSNAKAVCGHTVEFEIAETKEVAILRKGQVNKERLLFVKTGDDLDTIPAGASDSFRTQLRDYGIMVIDESFQDEVDNKQ